MKVVRAEVMGMCFGVRDALKVIKTISDPQSVTIHGQLVHNEVVLTQLDASGFVMSEEQSRQAVPETPVVLITAHGVSDRERTRLAEAGKQLVDTTCPLVTRAHTAALNLQSQGYFVVVIGRRGHVEVQGIIGDLERFDVVSTEDEVGRFPADRIGIVCQTTTPARTVERIRAAIERENPDAEIRFVDTVCLPTKEHQRSMERLLDQVEAMVVVGGKNSNNTRELVQLGLDRGVPSIHVQGPNDLDPEWLARFEIVGLTAGTSTLDSTIDEVHEAILQMTVNVEA